MGTLRTFQSKKRVFRSFLDFFCHFRDFFAEPLCTWFESRYYFTQNGWTRNPGDRKHDPMGSFEN